MRGMKVVKTGTNIYTTNPNDITLETDLFGGMKIHKVLRIKYFPAVVPVDGAIYSTYLNGGGGKESMITWAHNLDYSPAFMCFQYSEPSAVDGLNGVGYLAPASTIAGTAENLEAYSDLNNIYIHALPAGASSPYGTAPQWVVVVIFRESLDE